MSKRIPLQAGCTYHIYNRGINGETLFHEERNYEYFLHLYAKYIETIAETYCYALLGNHFHFLVLIKEFRSLEERNSYTPGRAFANLFGTYTKAFNKAYKRTGSLFEKPYKRKRIDNLRYLTRLIVYIHQNPQIHGLIDDFRLWPYSSYQAIIGIGGTKAQREAVLRWFGGRAAFIAAHEKAIDYKMDKSLTFDNGETIISL